MILEFMHEIFAPLMSKEASSSLYMGAGFVFALWYIPQIIRLHKDTTGAAAISINTLFFQLLLRMPGLVFASIALESTVFYVIFMDLVARVIVLAMTMHKRIKFHHNIGDNGLLDSLAAVDLNQDAIDTEIARRQHTKDMTKSPKKFMEPNSDEHIHNMEEIHKDTTKL